MCHKKLEPSCGCSIMELRILTNHERIRRGFTLDPNRVCCLDKVEDLDHLFRYCKMVQPIWEKMAGEEDYRGSQGRNSGWQDFKGGIVVGKKDLRYACGGSGDGEMISHYAKRRRTQAGKSSSSERITFKWMQPSPKSNQNILNGGRERVMTKWIGWAPPQQGWNTLNIVGCSKLCS